MDKNLTICELQGTRNGKCFSIFDNSINHREIWMGSVPASNEKVNLQKSLF